MMRVPLLYAINTAVLRSPRIELRPLVPDDARHFSALLGNDGAAIAMLSHMPGSADCPSGARMDRTAYRTRRACIRAAPCRRHVRGHERLRWSARGVPGFGYWIGAAFPRAGIGDGGGARLRRARAQPRGAQHGRRDVSGQCSLRARARKARFPGGGPRRTQLPAARRRRQLTLHTLSISEYVV